MSTNFSLTTTYSKAITFSPENNTQISKLMKLIGGQFKDYEGDYLKVIPVENSIELDKVSFEIDFL